MKGVGRNPKNEGRKKGGLKVHMLIDAHANTPTFVKISEAKSHDKNFIQYLNLPAHSMVVFDRAYNHYLQFAKFTEQQINFICRLKKNAVYEIIEETFTQTLTEKQSGVMQAEHIHLKYQEEKQQKTLCLRKVTYRDDKGRVYECISNNVEISNEEVALIYKIRWQIELLFKKLKQNFQLHYFKLLYIFQKNKVLIISIILFCIDYKLFFNIANKFNYCCKKTLNNIEAQPKHGYA
jgi:IS4 transposase